MSKRRNRSRQPATPADPASLATSAPQQRESAGSVEAVPAGEAPAPEAAAGPLTLVSVPVAGMTCRTCEVRIERYVRRLPNVERVSASAVRARVEIVSLGPIPPRRIAAAIEAAGYQIGETPWIARDRRVWLAAGGGILALAVIALLAQVTGIGDLASGTGDLEQGGILVALLLGLAAGVSTCMALIGGLILGLSAAFEQRRAGSGGGPAAVDGPAARLRPSLVFVAGRIAGYGIFGAALGALGASLTLPTWLIAVMMITVAIVMTIIGTRLTGISPRIAAWSPTLPTGLARSVGLESGTVSGYSDGRAAMLGAASFFLPCGFTQAVQVYALSTGSPLVGGVTLAVFALGTAPGLLALAGLPAVLPERARPALLRAVGVVVIGFAAINADAGLRLAGVTLPWLEPAAAAAAPLPAGTTTNGVQSLYTFQNTDGYSPGNVTIYAGMPTRWTIESVNARSCAAFLRIPRLNMAVTLRKGTNEIMLPAMKAQVLPYTCSMGMYGGTITIVNPPAGALEGAGGG